MPIERGKDAGCEDTGLPEERGQRGPVEGVQQSMPDGLSESSQVVQDDVSLWTKFILIRSVQMPAIEHREIGVGVEDCEDQAPLRMKHAVQLTNRDQWRGDERERQIADDAVEGLVLEGKTLRPIRLHPISG